MGFDEQSWKLPVPGNQFLFWLLQQGKEGENPYQSIRESFRKAYDAKTFLGTRFEPPDDMEDIGMSRVGMILFSGDYSTQTKILLAIIREVEGGEDFVKDILGIEV